MESRKAAFEEVRLQTTAKNRQRGCRRDVRRQTVPNTCCSDQKRAHLTKPGWSKPHTHSNSTNLVLFGHKITLYSFKQGAHTIVGGSNRSRGWAPWPLTLLRASSGTEHNVVWFWRTPTLDSNYCRVLECVKNRQRCVRCQRRREVKVLRVC